VVGPSWDIAFIFTKNLTIQFFLILLFCNRHLCIFSNEYVVSPEQSEDGMGDSGAALARDIITQHAATIATAITSNPAATTSQPQKSQHQQQQVMYAPVAAPPLLVAPPAPPQIAAQ
jgi:hypothetical protein